MSRSSGAAPGPSGGGPDRTACWNSRSSSSSSAWKIPARVPNRRNTVPLPRPARSASPSMVSWPAPCPAIISRAVASRSRRLRAASARSARGGPQVTGWFMGPTLRPEYNRGKVRLCLQRCTPPRKDQPMSTIATPDRYTTLPDEPTIVSAVTALEEHGFSTEVVDDLDAARQAVLARIPPGSSVMTNTSVTLQDTGIADAINDGGPYDSARNKMFALDFATQAQEMKAIGGQPDYALGSVHAVSRDGTLVIASASGSQLASYVWGAANVIFVIGAQKLVPTLAAAHERIYQHSLPLEDARAQVAYGQHSQVSKIVEIHTELPGRIHIVLIRQPVGFYAERPVVVRRVRGRRRRSAGGA